MNVYKNIEQHFIENRLFSNETLLEFIKQKIYEDSLEDYISNVEISANCESGFNMKNNSFAINQNEILYDVADKRIPNLTNMISRKEKRTGIINNPNSVNIYNLCNVRHELEHVLQEKMLIGDVTEINNDNCFNVWKLLLIEKDSITSAYDETYFNEYFYTKHHDYFFLEYSANIESYLETLYLVNAFHISDIKDILVLFNNIVARNLLFLYRDIENTRNLSTPSKNALKIHRHILGLLKRDNIKIEPANFDIYKGIDTPKEQIDRLRLGLSISSKTMNHINNVAINKDKTLNLFDDIRNI